MTLSTAFSYKEIRVFDLKTSIEALRYIIVNAILALILLFLTLEEIDWFFFSATQKNNDKVIDKTSWNIKSIF